MRMPVQAKRCPRIERAQPARVGLPPEAAKRELQTRNCQGNRLRIYAESPTALERGFSLLRTSLELFAALERDFPLVAYLS